MPGLAECNKIEAARKKDDFICEPDPQAMKELDEKVMARYCPTNHNSEDTRRKPRLEFLHL